MANMISAAPLTLLLAFPAFAQAEPAATAKPETFVVEAGNHPLPMLIERVATFLGYNILYNMGELGSIGEVRLNRRTEVDATGCWELFGTLLYHKGLAIITIDEALGFHEVIAMSGARQREITSNALFVKHDQVEAYAKLKATPILTSVPLKNINAQIAQNSMRPFFATTGSPGASLTVGTLGNNTDLLLQGFAPQVAAAVRMLQLVDVRSDEPTQTTQVVQLQHANADEIVAILNTTWGGDRQGQAAQGSSPVMPSLRAVAHNTLNAVILTGPTARISDGLALLAKLDAPAVAPNPETVELRRIIQSLEARLAALEKRLTDK